MRVGGSAGAASWDPEMSPRFKLTAVPYAFRAGVLAKLTGAFTSTLDFTTQTASRSLLLPDENGTLCVQSSSACGFNTDTSITLQDAYNATSGSSITTTDARDIDIVLANTATDANFDLQVATGSTGYVSITRADGAGSSDPAQLVLIDNLDTDRAQPIGLKVQSAAGTITTALDVSDAEIDTALSIGANNIVGTTGNIDLTNFDVVGSSGNTTVGGDLTVTGNSSLNGTLLTIGDASTDDVTVNSDAWTFANDTTLTLSGGVNGLALGSSTTLSVDATNSRVGIGTSAPSYKLVVTGTALDAAFGTIANFTGTMSSTTNNQQSTVLIQGSASPGSSVNLGYNGVYISPTTSSANLDQASAVLRGAFVGPYYAGTGTLSNLRGITIQNANNSTGTIGTNYGLEVLGLSNAAGTVTDNYGIVVAVQTSGANDYGVAIGAADTQTLWLSYNADNTTAAAGIAFGSSRDTNLYRSAANTLRTDDALTVTGLTTLNGGLTVEAGDTFTFNSDAITDLTGTGLTLSSGALTVDATSATGFFQNGGNSFGTSAVLGTNDSNSLTLETANTSRIAITSAGAITVSGATTFSAAGTALAVTNNADFGGILAVGSSGSIITGAGIFLSHTFTSTADCALGCYGSYNSLSYDGVTNPTIEGAGYFKTTHVSGTASNTYGILISNSWHH
jgi:hypothetical protein